MRVLGYQVRVTTGYFESTWMNSDNVKVLLRRPAPFKEDGPFSKIRWRFAKGN